MQFPKSRLASCASRYERRLSRLEVSVLQREMSKDVLYLTCLSHGSFGLRIPGPHHH